MDNREKPCAGSLPARRIRVHHLLCIPLFKGYGYSDSFCRNMAERIQELREDADAPLTAVCKADMICENCPNLTPEHTCRSSKESVIRKDRELALALGILENSRYTWRKLTGLAAGKLTKEMFEHSCRNCDWYAAGLCSYEGWLRSIGSMQDNYI